LESQKPAEDEDKNAVYLPELVKTWGFASTSNDDSLLSAVPAVLGLLLKTISTNLELTQYGLRLGRTLLQKNQQELLARGLTAKKDWVSSPALRLLRELLVFDGGVLASQVFRARDQMFRGLAKNLRDVKEKRLGEEVENRRRPSVRTNALRVMLAAIKFLSAKEKRELLNIKELVAAFTRNIFLDPPFMIREILETLKSSILQNEEVPREAKTKIVNANSLKQISTLYHYHQQDEEASTGKKPTVVVAAHQFLLLACTSPDLGVLNRQSGLYPRGIDPDDTPDLESDQETIELGLDSIEWMDQFTKDIPLRNTILSEFIQNLSPWSNTNQSELLLTIMKHAPELFADYFMGKKDFSFEPKLTATWIGYAAFLFSSIQLPIPQYFGYPQRYARLPPPTSIVLENILPQALSQKALTRCLNLGNNLISFFAIRLLCVALNKFRDTFNMYQEAAAEGNSKIWTEAAERLTIGFCQRCPTIKDVITAFRRISNTDLMQREAVTKLLVLYFEVVPRLSLDLKFDVSATLAEVLTMDEQDLSAEDRALHAMEVENIFQFAHFSPGTRWFAKAGGLTISPFMAMLKLSAEAPAGIPLLKLRGVLESVVKENQLLQMQTSISALENLILRLREANGPNSGAVWEFIDDCISRCASKPVKYIFSLEEFQAEAHGSDKKQRPLSLLTLVLLEQWDFIAKLVDVDVLKEIAEFVTSYLASCINIKEDKKVLRVITQKFVSKTESLSVQDIIKRSQDLVDTIAVPLEASVLSSSSSKPDGPTEVESPTTMAHMLESPESPEDHQELVKWNIKEVDEVIEGGHAAALIRLLSSEHFSIRKEASTSLSKFSAKLKASTFEEKDQIWLLLAEIIETAKKTDGGPLPGIISAFAASAVAVLNDPLHCLYEKINKFLGQGPTWDLDKPPLMYKILDEAPSLDDTHYLETAWLLDYMLTGLRTEADMSIFRKRRVFEKLFTLYNNPYLAPGLRDNILKILYRATTIEGGSTTLITRFSTMTWLQAQAALGGGISLKLLMEQVLASCEQKRVGIWSKKGIEGVKSSVKNF
jgi:nucleolar pre-ribosomal-associated protein 1